MARKSTRRHDRNAEFTRDFIFYSPFERRERGAWMFKKRDRETGKVIKVTCTHCRCRADALAFRKARIDEQLLAELQGPETTLDGERTLKELFAQWIETLKSELRPSTFSDIKTLCVPVQVKRGKPVKGEEPTYHEGLYVRSLNALGCVRPQDVGYEHIERLLKVEWASLKGRTLLRHFFYLRRFFNWCVKRKVIKDNPAAAFEIPDRWRKDVQKAAKNTGQVMIVEDARRFLSACKEKFAIECTETSASHPRREAGQKWVQECSPRAYLSTMVLTGFLSGLRLGNILGLRWKHIDLTDGVLRIPAAEMKNDEDLEVPIHDELWAHFRELLAKATKKRGHAPQPEDFVLGCKVVEMKKAFNGALCRSNLWDKKKPFRAHDMRHSFRTWLAQAKAGDAAETLLGHKLSGNDVTRRYIHYTLDDLRQEVNKIPRLGVQEEEQAQEAQ